MANPPVFVTNQANHKTIRFHLGYFLTAIVLFIVEVLIAKYVTGWVRAYIGDVLVVILMYAAIMSIFNINKRAVIIGTLLFSFAVEFSQYFKLAEVSGFEQGSIAYTVIGNSFSVIDLICYSVGSALIWQIEKRLDLIYQR